LVKCIVELTEEGYACGLKKTPLKLIRGVNLLGRPCILDRTEDECLWFKKIPRLKEVLNNL